MDELAVVGTYASEMEAALIVQRLAGAGIRATTRSDTIGGTIPSMEFAGGGIEVLVPAARLAAALQELGRGDRSDAPRDRGGAHPLSSESGRLVRRAVAIGVALLLVLIVVAAMLSFLDGPIP
jgi:hypothetical protein